MSAPAIPLIDVRTRLPEVAAPTSPLILVIVVPNTGSAIGWRYPGRLTAGTASATPAMTTKLVLHPGRRALVRIKRALHSRRPLIAQVRIGAHDGAGNAGPARTVSVRIVR